MPKLTYYHLGNADCCLMDFSNGKKMLVDYANVRTGTDDRCADLPALLLNDLDAASKRRYYDVVAFTHLDLDHVKGAPAFFYLECEKQYQSGDRVKINELWVPAAAITEDDPKMDGDSKAIQKEAQHRLRQKSGIRVFSKPDKLKEWVEKQGIAWKDVAHLITDAGTVVPTFSTTVDGAEFFAHSPFAAHVDECGTFKRNDACLVFQATFTVNGVETRLLTGADITHEVWTDIVKITRRKKNEHRLIWDVAKATHHCSYLGLGPDKGASKTPPVPEVEWLFEEQGTRGSIIVSSSNPIPAGDTNDPPHRQAARYYKDIAAGHGGDFRVTMEYPKVDKPQPTVIEISGLGAKLKKESTTGGGYATAVSARRAG